MPFIRPIIEPMSIIEPMTTRAIPLALSLFSANFITSNSVFLLSYLSTRLTREIRYLLMILK